MPPRFGVPTPPWESARKKATARKSTAKKATARKKSTARKSTARKTAVTKGIISQQDASSLSDQEAMMLVFRSGFSTASGVTRDAGRPSLEFDLPDPEVAWKPTDAVGDPYLDWSLRSASGGAILRAPTGGIDWREVNHRQRRSGARTDDHAQA
jgi:hypothetical protein